MKRGVAILLPFALFACGDDDRDTSAAAPVVFVRGEATESAIQFGDNFMAGFALANTNEPREPDAAGVPPLDMTAEPLDN